MQEGFPTDFAFALQVRGYTYIEREGILKQGCVHSVHLKTLLQSLVAGRTGGLYMGDITGGMAS